MKTVSADIITREEAATRRPSEIFHVWRDDLLGHWYYTSLDTSISYGGNTYAPATIKRGKISWDSSLEVSTLEIYVSRLDGPVPEFLSLNPVDIIWIQVSKIFLDDSPYEAVSEFVGQIKEVTFQGLEAVVQCVGFEHYLKQQIPYYRYQPQCNWALFDSKCSLSKASYRVSAVLSAVSSDTLTLTSSTFGDYADGYFAYGELQWDYKRRMIAEHKGTKIKLRYPITGLASGQTVEVYPGCQGNTSICKNRFNNIVNFGGHPYLPLDNPCTWE